jgi:hypothetical protein
MVVSLARNIPMFLVEFYPDLAIGLDILVDASHPMFDASV